MSDDDLPPPRRKPIPLFLWAVIGFLLVLGFMFAMRALSPHAEGVSAPASDLVLPDSAKPAQSPDVRPVT